LGGPVQASTLGRRVEDLFWGAGPFLHEWSAELQIPRLPQISCQGLRLRSNYMWFSLKRTTYLGVGESGEAGNPGTLGMTKRRGSQQEEGGCQRRTRLPDPNNSSVFSQRTCPLATALSFLRPSPFCHPERSRGICSSTDPSWKNAPTPFTFVFRGKRSAITHRFPPRVLRSSLPFDG
jgi:hypothetical protein